MFSSSTSPSFTTVRLRQISKSPLSGFTMTSKFSSVSYFFRSWLRKASSIKAINVTLSIFFSSLNARKLSIIAWFSILFPNTNKVYLNLIPTLASVISANAIVKTVAESFFFFPGMLNVRSFAVTSIKSPSA